MYAAAQAGWAAAGVPPAPIPTVPLPASARLALAVIAAAAGAAALASRRTAPGRGNPWAGPPLLLGFVMCAAGTTGAPMQFVTLVSGAGAEGVAAPLDVALHATGAALLLGAWLAHRRRGRGRCPRCGGAHPGAVTGRLARPAPSRAPARVRVAAWLLLGGLLPWAGVKTVWTLGGGALGVSARDWRTGAGDAAVADATAAAGVDFTVLVAAAGAFLALGLLYPWGQVFPRWTPFLAGRRVPRALPLVPAWLTALTLAPYGCALLAYAALAAAGVLPPPAPVPPFTGPAGLTWMIAFGGLAFAGLGLALLAGAISYTARTRPACEGVEAPA
ncbi:hypothetical protein D5H75_07260 [Bailinhaonella thermotolerans]|uniref:Uncharacterized protein n=1 Tax=Bailinhaonella thermotolerans TaxID=1070861 RepID=A0A3A4B974_9ACTN|nr:hypothetical protein D5H75_07260 [Bailinhaonella thermotolerans]